MSHISFIIWVFPIISFIFIGILLIFLLILLIGYYALTLKNEESKYLFLFFIEDVDDPGGIEFLLAEFEPIYLLDLSLLQTAVRTPCKSPMKSKRPRRC